MNVSLHIQSKQKRATFAEEPVSQIQRTTGIFDDTDTGFRLTYQEPDKSVGGTCVLTYNGAKLTLERTSHGRTVMVFTHGVATECAYHTAYGTIALTIVTKNLKVVKTDNGCRISMTYTLENPGLDTMEISFSLFAKEAKEALS